MSELRARNAGRGAEARPGGRAGGGRGGGDPGRGERSLEAERRHGAAPAGPGRGSLPAPAPGPASRPRGGAPREPRPGPAASGRLLPWRPLPQGVYRVPSRCAAASCGTCHWPCHPRGAGGSGVLGRGGGSAAHTRGRTEGCWSPRRPDARAEVRGHPATTRRVLSNQRQWGSPLPPSHLGPTLDSQGSAPWALHSPSLLRFALEGPAASQSSQLGLPRGLGVEANRGEGRAAPPPGGEGSALLRRARPPGMPCSWRPSAASAGDVLGLLPSAFGDLPSSNSHEPWGETAASEPRSGLLDPRRETGTTPEAREAHLRSRW